MSEIEMKIDKECEDIKKICTKLTDKLMACLDAGFDQADANEVGLVVDMIKDLCDAKEKAVKGLYYKQIMEAMDESDYGEDYDEDGPVKYYRGRSSRTGRYVHRPYTKMMERDVDRDDGKMYYTDYVGDTNAYVPNGRYYTGSSMGNSNGGAMGNSGGSSRSYESRYDRTRRSYQETKEMNPGDSDKEKDAKVKSLDEHLTTLQEDFKELVPKMDRQEKVLMKNRLQEMQNTLV